MTVLDALDPLLASPKKLAALGMLAKAQEVEFAFIRDHLSLSDSDLSKQVGALAGADYLKMRKSGRGADRRTWLKITRTGTHALAQHSRALTALVNASIPPPATPPPPPERHCPHCGHDLTGWSG